MTKEKRVTITISKKAADALAWKTLHGMYGPDISTTILQNMSEWLCRDRPRTPYKKLWEEAGIDGSFEELMKEQKQ